MTVKKAFLTTEKGQTTVDHKDERIKEEWRKSEEGRQVFISVSNS